MLTRNEQAAWNLYCADADDNEYAFWWELPVETRVEYLHKAEVEVSNVKTA